MDSSSPLSPSTSAAPPLPEVVAEPQLGIMYKTKAIDFFGRTTPIVLQNNNGPCPLLSICNVLSLKNSLNLSPDMPVVSQEKLLSLVAERLIDSNSKIDNKDAEYVKNQQQNIADAIDLLHRLATGIDVNIKFRRIDDFEFTPERAIFDLLEIPLYLGWIVDPQDTETADAIGSKSYNSLMGELVSLETQAMEIKNLDGDTVDFVAATTAALGVPSPSLSRSQSFTDSPRSKKKGDMEEEAELLRVLKLSEAETHSSAAASVVADDDSAHAGKSELLMCSETAEKHLYDENLTVDKGTPVEFTYKAAWSLPMKNLEGKCVEQNCEESKISSGSAVENSGCDLQIRNEKALSAEVPSSSSQFLDGSRNNEPVENEFTSPSGMDGQSNITNDSKAGYSPTMLNASADLGSSNVLVDKPEVFTSIIDVSEPIYEGEECIIESGTVDYENQEPIYEGEVALAEQVDSGEVIRNFLKNTASQLTKYGLNCLQDKVKEAELCVFFRNNHFNTMFKNEGKLYILATDQGFIIEPKLVWEKLNAVNGNTGYVKANFEDFKMDDHLNGTWDEQHAMASTTDYLSSTNNVAQSDTMINSDLQLAIALQEQEFEQQQPQQSVQPTVARVSGPITGPQVSDNSRKRMPSPSKQDLQSKERCRIM